MKVEVDQDLCVSSGQCVLSDPQVFDQDDDGIVVLLDASPGAEHAHDVLEAERLCPARAIKVTE